MDFKFGRHVNHTMFQPAIDKSSLKGANFRILHPIKYLQNS